MRVVRQCRSLAAVARARFLVRFFPLRVALRLNQTSIHPHRSPSDFDPLELVGWAASKIPGATCVPRAMAAQRLLAKSGRAGTLIFGVRRLPNGRLDAHAWVEENGVVVHGGVPHLAEFARLPLGAVPPV